MDVINEYVVHNEANNDYPRAAIICCAVSCTLSIFGSFVIFGTFAALPEIRNFTRKLILFLTVADCVSAAGYILGMIQTTFVDFHDMCVIQSFITTFSSLVSFFLTMSIVAHLCVTIVYKSEFEDKQRFIFFATISLVIPGVIIVVAYSEDALGPTSTKGTGPWCWIKSAHKHYVMWQVVAGKGWEILCYLVTVSYFILLKLYLYLKHRHQRFHSIHISLRDEDRNFLYVWLVFYCIRMWGTIRFLSSAIDPEGSDKHYMKVLLYFQSIGDPLPAFGNCILFCFFDRTVRAKLFCGYFIDQTDFEETIDSDGITQSLNNENANPKTPLLSDGRYIHFNSVDRRSMTSPRYLTPDGEHFVSPKDGFISQTREFEESRDFRYDSPVSTPCHTPKHSPDSFTSIVTD